MPNDRGFLIVGVLTGERISVLWPRAFTGFASLDQRARVDSEAHLSAFTFGEDLRSYLESTGSTKHFDGVCGADFIWFDLDRSDLESARRDAIQLYEHAVGKYGTTEDLLIFFSGSKGFHIGLPTALWQPPGSLSFNKVARRFVETLATSAKVEIDKGIYDKVRTLRAPNSRHPKTGLHKRVLTLEELKSLSVEQIQQLAKEPAAFQVPKITKQSEQAAADWQAADRAVAWEAESLREHRALSNGTAKLNRSTIEFIRNGAETGGRHRLLFSAAANLAELGCPPTLAHQLLTEAALDSGLSPSDTRRQIDCGLQHIPKAN